jgi:hypothetical protein
LKYKKKNMKIFQLSTTMTRTTFFTMNSQMGTILSLPRLGSESASGMHLDPDPDSRKRLNLGSTYRKGMDPESHLRKDLDPVPHSGMYTDPAPQSGKAWFQESAFRIDLEPNSGKA